MLPVPETALFFHIEAIISLDGAFFVFLFEGFVLSPSTLRYSLIGQICLEAYLPLQRSSSSDLTAFHIISVFWILPF